MDINRFTIAGITLICLLAICSMYKHLARAGVARETLHEHRKRQYQKEFDTLVSRIEASKLNHRVALTQLFEFMIENQDIDPYFIYCIGPKDIDPSKQYYAQCVFYGDSEIMCEVVSNQFLEPTYHLTDQQINNLLSQGWELKENFRLVLPSTNIDELVNKCIKALQVYGLSEDSEIKILGWPLS